MIIATALGVLFNGLQITYKDAPQSVRYGYGDQKELNRWLNDNRGKRKFPLIWYVLSPFTEFDGWYETDATLYIFQQTDKKQDWDNPTRAAESYTKIIDPVWDKSKEALIKSQLTEIRGTMQDRFTIVDEPNFGIDRGGELRGANGSKTPTVSTEITDARMITFRLRINAKCII